MYMEPLIAEYVANYKPFIDRVLKLSETLSKVTTDTSYEELSEEISLLCGLFEKIRKFKVEVGISGYFLFWAQMQYFQDKVKAILEIIEANFGKDMKTFVTQTTVGEILREEHRLVETATKATSRNTPILEKLCSMISDAIILLMDPEGSLEAIQKEFRVEPQVVDLYITIMNKLLLKYTEERQFALTNKIMNFISEDKHWVLSRGIPREKITNDMPCSTFGLISLSAGRELAELQPILQIEAKHLASIEKLAKWLNSQGTDLIIINRIVEYPVEYNIYGLLNKSVDKNQGITEKYIDDFKTVTISDSRYKWNFSIKLHAAKASEKVLVLCATSSKFSIMSIYMGGPPYLFKSSVEELYSYIAGKQSTHRQNYNHKIIELAKENMFLDVKFHIDEADNTDYGIKTIINDLYLDIYSAFIKKLPKRYPSEVSQLRAIFVQEEFKSLIDSNLTAKFHLFFRKNLYDVNIDKVHVGEVYMTFIFHLEYIKRAFYKELGDKFTQSISTMTPDDESISAITKKFEVAIIQILEKLISQDSNIFREISRKVRFLKLELT